MKQILQTRNGQTFNTEKDILAYFGVVSVWKTSDGRLYAVENNAKRHEGLLLAINKVKQRVEKIAIDESERSILPPETVEFVEKERKLLLTFLGERRNRHETSLANG